MTSTTTAPTAPATVKDWEIHTVAPSPRGGFRITGINHCARGEAINWSIDWYSFRDLESFERRYDFSGATFAPGMRDKFEGFVSRAAARAGRR